MEDELFEDFVVFGGVAKLLRSQRRHKEDICELIVIWATEDSLGVARKRPTLRLLRWLLEARPLVLLLDKHGVELVLAPHAIFEQLSVDHVPESHFEVVHVDQARVVNQSLQQTEFGNIGLVIFGFEVLELVDVDQLRPVPEAPVHLGRLGDHGI